MLSSATPVADAQTIRQSAHHVLAGSDYELSSTENLRRLIEWIEKLLRPLFGLLSKLYDFSPILFFVFMGLLIVILVALIWHIVYSFAVAIRKRTRVDDYSLISDSNLSSPESWELNAHTAFEGENYLQAIRFILRASLMRLEQSRLSSMRRGATNREYLRKFQNTAAFNPLATMVGINDSRWFGRVECSRNDAEICFDAHRDIQQVISGGGTVDQRS